MYPSICGQSRATNHLLVLNYYISKSRVGKLMWTTKIYIICFRQTLVSAASFGEQLGSCIWKAMTALRLTRWWRHSIGCRPNIVTSTYSSVLSAPNTRTPSPYDLSRDMTKPTKWLCAQRRLRSAWASAQSDQSSLSV